MNICKFATIIIAPRFHASRSDRSYTLIAKEMLIDGYEANISGQTHCDTWA